MSDIARRAAVLSALAALFVLPVTGMLLVFAGLFAFRPRRHWQP
jgi:hypothetical protein